MAHPTLTKANPFPEHTRLTPPPELAELTLWDLHSFYRTTGDAIQKYDRGVKPDLVAYQAKVREIILTREPSPSLSRFAGEVRAMQVELVSYRDRLVALRGADVHLETSHEPDDDYPHRLAGKNPKKQKVVD